MGETLTGHAHTVGLTGQPLYQQIASDLRARILQQEFSAGSYLPTEERLCAHYQVSRFTIREALRQLQQEGLISRRRGAGTLIQHDGSSVLPPAPKTTVASSTDSLLPGRFGGASTVVADERFAQRFGCTVGSRWLVRSALCASASGQPVGLVEIFLPSHRKDLTDRIQPGFQPVAEQLGRLGEPLGRVQMKVQAITPTQTEARLLNIAALAPCLRITYSCQDPRGEMLAFATHLHPGHSFTYEADLTPATGDPAEIAGLTLS